MPDILDLIEPETLGQQPPRRLPPFFVLNLIGEYLLAGPLWAYLHPFVVVCSVAALAVAILGAPAMVSLGLIALAALGLVRPVLRLYRDVRDDYMLLRHGIVVTAHIIGVRTVGGPGGVPAGAYLDCAVPLTRQRTSVGSVWVSDPGQAMRISAAGRLSVICLPHAPGTWRLYRPPNPPEVIGRVV